MIAECIPDNITGKQAFNALLSLSIGFTVNPEDSDEFLNAWEANATYFKSQSGLISAQPHKGNWWQWDIFVNYAIWEFTAQLKKAVNNTNFQTRLSKYPAGTIISPHVFKKIAVPLICVE
jgi:quinol monooxygenase YgiN